jgi:ketosteroid isomerase-like protein
MKARIVAVCAICAAAALGCSRSNTLPAATTSAFEQAFTKHDLAACLALFTNDAQILPQHGPVISGSTEIEAFLKDNMTPVTSFDTETQMTLVDGDLGVEQGAYRVRDVRRGSDVEMGKYVHVWRRQGGEWKLHRIIYNTNVEPRADIAIESADDES